MARSNTGQNFCIEHQNKHAVNGDTIASPTACWRRNEDIGLILVSVETSEYLMEFLQLFLRV